jgi:hypothetical protein
MATRTAPTPVMPNPPAETARERWAADFDELRDELHIVDLELKNFVRRRPLAALAAALAAGYVAGRILSRV